MASTKKLRANAQKFRKNNKELHGFCSYLIGRMAQFIEKTGSPEVTVGYNRVNGYYEQANN